jgi:hypothetical protein
MHILNDEKTASFYFVALSAGIDTLQLCYFSFSPGIPWHKTIGEFMMTMTSIINYSAFVSALIETQSLRSKHLTDSSSSSSPSSFARLSLKYDQFFWVIVSGILLFVFLTIGHATYVAASFASGELKAVWSFGILRRNSRLLIGILFVPITSTLLQVYSCDAETNHHTIATASICYEGKHLGFVILSSIALLCFILFATLTSLMFVDRDPWSNSYLAASTGRINCVILVIKFLIDASFTVSKSNNFLVVVLLLGSASLIGMFSYYLPFFKHESNKIHILCYTVFFWASVCAALSITVDDTSDLGGTFSFFSTLLPLLFTV